MSSIRKTTRAAFDEVAGRLGFTVRRNGVHELPFAPGVWGRLAATIGGWTEHEIAVQVLVGVHHEQLLRDRAARGYGRAYDLSDATVIDNLWGLLPAERREWYVIGSEDDIAPVIARIESDIADYGIPFMRRMASLSEVAAFFLDPPGDNWDPYMPPLAYLYAGELERARASLPLARAQLIRLQSIKPYIGSLAEVEAQADREEAVLTEMIDRAERAQGSEEPTA